MSSTGGAKRRLVLDITSKIKMHYAYVLFSLRDKKFYIGLTADIKRRLKEHNYGKTASTLSRRPLELIYYEAHLSKNDAVRRENYFKSTKGRITLKQILRDSLKRHKM